MAASSPDILRVQNLGKRFSASNGNVYALRGVNFTLSSTETLAVLGPTGCGKSTLLFLLAGLIQPTEGVAYFKDHPVVKAHREIALVLQNYGLFPWKTVRKNVELGLKIRKETIDTERVDSLLHELGIGDKQKQYPHQLSGGQQQRVALARALILQPSLLLMDEPFAALDTLTRERLQDVCADLWRSHQFGMILVTHNIQEAVRLGKRIAIMAANPGQIVTIVNNPEAMTENHRGSDRFYDRAREIRNLLEVQQETI